MVHLPGEVQWKLARPYHGPCQITPQSRGQPSKCEYVYLCVIIVMHKDVMNHLCGLVPDISNFDYIIHKITMRIIYRE